MSVKLEKKKNKKKIVSKVKKGRKDVVLSSKGSFCQSYHIHVVSTFF